MKKISVRKSSDYWFDFEAERSVYYSFIWNNEKSMKYFHSNEQEFIAKYKLLTSKFGICEPINDLEFSQQDYFFFSLYESNGKYFYPTKLFLDVKDESPHKIISIDPHLSLSENSLKFEAEGSTPFRIELFKKEKEVLLLCYLDNDVFNLELDNKKSREKNGVIDNSELAYLNTPRLNSFLKQLKTLCDEFKMNKFEFEDLGLNDFTADGVLFNNEIVYYEDIKDVLLPRHQM